MLKNPTNITTNSMLIHADFMKELLVPLSTYVENLEDLNKIFSELALILNMRRITLYKMNNDWTSEIICENERRSEVIIKAIDSINLFIAWKTNKISAIPLPKFWDNIVIPVGIDNLFLAAGDSESSREIEKIENSLFELVATVISNALRSMKLIEQANTDKLTGLLNRNALDKYIYEWKNPFNRNVPDPKAICMLDIDHFKRFNDTFGHDVGDKVLNHVASVCKEYFWEKNLVYRFWWEEMTFVIMQDSKFTIKNYVDKLRKKISETPLIYEWKSYQVNVSIWIFIFDKKENINPDAKFFAIKYADQALYKAKESWRNKVWVFNKND